MANTQNYINHLLQNTGITPACSEEERLAAEDIAQIFRNHGFDPEVQEFNAPAPSRLAFAVTGILAFAGALLMGIGGGIGEKKYDLGFNRATSPHQTGSTMKPIGAYALGRGFASGQDGREPKCHRLPQGLGPARVSAQPPGGRCRTLRLSPC